MQLLAEMHCDLVLLIDAQHSRGSSCAHSSAVAHCLDTLFLVVEFSIFVASDALACIHIDTVQTLLLTSSSIVVGFTCLRLKKYHIKMMVN